MKPADQIRSHIKSNHIDPARLRGDTRITLRSGDIHSELGFSSRLPNVCQVLRGKKLQEAANVKLLKASQSDDGANVYFTYRFSTSGYLEGKANLSDNSQVMIKSSVFELFGEVTIGLTKKDWIGCTIFVPNIRTNLREFDLILENHFNAFIWLHETPEQGQTGNGLTAEVTLSGLTSNRTAKIIDVEFFDTVISGQVMFATHQGQDNILGHVNSMRRTCLWPLSIEDVDLLLNETEQTLELMGANNNAHSPSGPQNLESEKQEYTLRQVQIRRNQSRFRKKLIKHFGECCMLTGASQREVLEAAHIVPYRLGLSDRNAIGNGLLLRSDIHKLFDSFLISIDPSVMEICLSKSLEDEYQFLSKKNVPNNTHSKNASWHFQEFLRCEALR